MCNFKKGDLYERDDGAWIRVDLVKDGNVYFVSHSPTQIGSARRMGLDMFRRAMIYNGFIDGQPQAQCPKCFSYIDDFDGFGVLAHTRPAYTDGCGYCSHPSRDGGVCVICGES